MTNEPLVVCDIYPFQHSKDQFPSKDAIGLHRCKNPRPVEASAPHVHSASCPIEFDPQGNKHYVCGQSETVVQEASAPPKFCAGCGKPYPCPSDCPTGVLIEREASAPAAPPVRDKVRDKVITALGEMLKYYCAGKEVSCAEWADILTDILAAPDAELRELWARIDEHDICCVAPHCKRRAELAAREKELEGQK